MVYLSFGIPIDGVDVLSIFTGIVDLFGSSWVFFETAFVIFTAILFPTKSPISSAVFWIALSNAVFSASVGDIFCGIKNLWSKFTAQNVTQFFYKGKKSIALNINLISGFS